MGERDVEIEEMLFLNPSPLWGEGRVRGDSRVLMTLADYGDTQVLNISGSDL
jgi:hypothetical protein